MKSRSWILPGILVVLILALLGTAGVIHSRQRQGIDPAMLVAARTQAKDFVSLDYRHADADVDKVIALATGKFKKDYAAARDQLVAGVKSKKIVTVGTIPEGGAAVEFADGDRGQVLVVVDVSRTIGRATDSLQYRSRLLLTRVNGHWLVSAVNEVG